MVQYICRRCGYSTTVKCNYYKHLHQRKEVCEDIIEDVPIDDLRAAFDADDAASSSTQYKCEICSKTFKSRSGYYGHRKQCTDATTIQSQMKSMESKIEQMTEQLYKIQLPAIEEALQRNKRIGTTITNNMTMNNSSVNIHIHINEFGKENKEYIGIDFARRCFNMGWYGIMPMMDKIYFDMEHPENHNVELTSLKHSFARVKTGDEWKVQGLNESIDTMINTSGTHIITSIYDDIRNNPTPETLTNMNSIQNLESSAHQRLRERTRARLMERREALTRATIAN